MAEINTRKRGDKWEYRFEAAKVDGKRKQISKGGFRTKKEALEAGTKALAEYNNSGTAIKQNQTSISDYLDYWFDNVAKMNLKYNTQIGYLNIIENHLKPNFGIYKLQTLTAAPIQEFINSLKIKGLSRNSVVGILSVLSSALQYAMEPLHYIQYNPCINVKIPAYKEAKKKERVIICVEDFNTIINRFPEGSNFYIPLMIGYYTGLRISEAFALTWDDIDFKNETLTVNKITVKRNYSTDVRQTLKNKEKKEEKSAWYFGSPKTKASYRTIKIGKTLLDALKREKKRQLESRLEYGEYYNRIYKKPEKDEKGETIYRLVEIEAGIPCTLELSNMLCIRENGQFISTDSFKYCSRVIHHELKLAFDYHSLRHTHATFLIENGANYKDVQARLGHENIETTLQTYTHATEKMAIETVNIFENVVNGFVHQ